MKEHNKVNKFIEKVRAAIRAAVSAPAKPAPNTSSKLEGEGRK